MMVFNKSTIISIIGIIGLAFTSLYMFMTGDKTQALAMFTALLALIGHTFNISQTLFHSASLNNVLRQGVVVSDEDAPAYLHALADQIGSVAKPGKDDDVIAVPTKAKPKLANLYDELVDIDNETN